MNISQAQTCSDFIDAARDYVAASDIISYYPDNLDFLTEVVKVTSNCSYDWYYDGDDFLRLVFEHGMRAAQNGGYYHYENGEIVKWEKDGSGAEACEAWLYSLTENNLKPMYDIVEHIDDIYWPVMRHLPYRFERLNSLREFCDSSHIVALADLIKGSLDDKQIWRLDWTLAGKICAMFPASFGGDPFRKKACLMLLTLSGNMVGNGQTVEYNLPVPCDYQLPRVLGGAGVIAYGSEVDNALNGNILLSTSNDIVTTMRAVTAVACDDLAKRCGVQSFKVDNALFRVVRQNKIINLDRFATMKCDTFWF